MATKRRIPSFRRVGWAKPALGTREEPELVQLYLAYSPLILSHCTRLLRDRSWAEDATHDIFLRVQRHAGSLPEHSEIRPWLFRVATNHCLNELRNRDVRLRALPRLHSEQVHNHEDTLAARNDAQRFLERLPPRARAVAWLTYVDGMLQREVADTLKVSRRTVVDHLTQVRHQARENP